MKGQILCDTNYFDEQFVRVVEQLGKELHEQRWIPEVVRGYLLHLEKQIEEAKDIVEEIINATTQDQNELRLASIQKKTIELSKEMDDFIKRWDKVND
ncbi:hypothetical protein [Bacillus sp. 2205SS5-2]|uniref:hypothetical protein n=1 Tax=Bacillus sp. 2205SS5-2 TaxID=3109031 RepID=UPI0030061729